MTSRRGSTVNRRGLEQFSGPRRLFFPAVVALLLTLGCEFRQQSQEGASAAGPSGVDSLAVIEDMLHASADSWNSGDLDGFMDDYWRSERLSFSGGTGVTRGWGEVRRRYLESYWAPGAVRDSLRFEDLEVSPLGAAHALAMGRYVLYRPEDDEEVASSGFFTLILAKMDGEWKIIHDHTSATPSEGGSRDGGVQDPGEGSSGS